MMSHIAHRQDLLLAGGQALFQIVSVLAMMAGGKITTCLELATMHIAAIGPYVPSRARHQEVWLPRGVRSRRSPRCSQGPDWSVRYMARIPPPSILQHFACRCLSGIRAVLSLCGRRSGGRGFPTPWNFASSGGRHRSRTRGPMLARFGGPLFQAEYAGSFALLALVSAMSAAMLLNLHITLAKTEVGRVAKGRNWAGGPMSPALRATNTAHHLRENGSHSDQKKPDGRASRYSGNPIVIA